MAKSYENKVVLSFEVDTKAAEQQLTKMFKMSEKLSEQEQEERVAYALKAWNKILDMYAKNTDKIKGYNISSDLAGINLQLRDPSKITDAQAFVDKIATLYESIQTIIDSTTKSTAGIFSTIDQSKQNKTIKDIQNLRDWYTRRANKTTTYEIDTNGNYVLDDGNRKRTYKEVSNPGYYRNISVRNEGAESNGWQELRPSDVMAEIKSMPEYQKALDKVGKEHAEALMKALGITDQNVINEYLDNITAYNTLMSQMNVKYDAKNKSFYIDKARINSNPELKGLTGEKRLQKYTEIYGGMERYIPMLQFLQDQIKTMENGFSGFDKLETEDKANAISTDPTRWVNEGLVKDFFSQYQTLFENTLDNMFTELRKQIKIQTNQILGEAAKASTERANKKFATYSDKYMSGIDSTTGNGVGGNATNVDEGNQNGSESTTESVSGIEKKTTKFDQFAVSVEGATKAVQELMKAYVEIDKKANEKDVSNELYDKLDNQRKEIMKNIAIYEGIFEKYKQIPNFKELIKSNKQFADVENFESIMDYVTEPTKEEASFSHYDETTYNKWYAAQDKTKKVKNEIDVDDVYLQNLANVVGYSREISESVEHVQSQMQETAEIAKQTGEKTTSAVDETNEAVEKTKNNVDALNKSLGNISDESIKAITDAFKELNEQVKSIVEQINKFNDNLKVGNTKVNVQEKSGVKSEINSDASNDIKTIATNSKKLDDIKKALDEVKASIDKCCEIKKDSNGKELTPEELSKLANASKKIGELSDEVSKQNFSININSAKVDTESFVNSILDQLKDINIPINISPNINSNNTTGHVYTAYDALIDRVYANILNHNATTNKNGVRYHDDRANLIEKKDEKGNVTDSIWATRHGNNITDAYADRREAMIVASSRHNVMSTPYVNGSSESVPAELEEAILQDAMKRYGLKKEDFDISMHTHPAEFASFSWDGGTNTSGDIPHDLLRPYIKTAIVAANKEIAMLHLDKIPKAKLEEAMKNGLDLYNNPDRENEHKQLEDSIWNQYSTYNAERFYNGFKNGAFSYSKDSNFISQNLVKLLNENGIKNVEKYQNTDFVKTIFDDAVKRTSDGIDKNQIFKTVEDLESALLNNFKQEFSNNLKGVTLPKDKLNEISEAIWNTVFKVDTVTGDGFVGSLDHQPFADITKEDFKAIQERETLKREITKLGYDANKVYEVLPIEEFKKKYQYHGLSDSIIGNGTSNNTVSSPQQFSIDTTEISKQLDDVFSAERELKVNTDNVVKQINAVFDKEYSIKINDVILDTIVSIQERIQSELDKLSFDIKVNDANIDNDSIKKVIDNKLGINESNASTTQSEKIHTSSLYENYINSGYSESFDPTRVKQWIEEFLTSMTSQFADARSRISNSQSTSANNQRDKYIDQFRTLLGQYQKINEKGVNSELSLMDTHKLSESSDKLAEIINQVRALGDSVEDVNGTIDMLQQEWNDVDKIIKTTRDDAEAKKQADEETKLKNERETNVKNAITSAQTASKNSVMAQRQFVSTARGIDKTTDSLENLSPTAVQNVVDATTEYNKQRQALIDLKEQYKNYDDIVAQIDKVLNDMDTEQKQVTESMNTQGTKMQAENKLVQDLIDAYKKYYDIKSKALNGKATDTEVETAKANVDKLQSEVDSIKSDLSNDVLNNLSTQMSNIENNFEDKRELKIISDLTEAWKKYYETKKKALSNSATDEQVDEAKNNIALAEAPYNQIKDRLTQEQREKIGNTISGYKTDYEQTRAKRGDIEMQKQEYKELSELYNQFLKARKNVITGNDDKNNTQLQLANNLLTQIIEKKKEINQLGLTDVDIEKSLAQQLGFQLKQTKQRQDMTNTQRAESKFNQINNGVYGYLYNIQQYESGDITLAQNGQLQRYVGNVDDAIKLLDKVNNTLSNGDNA